MLSQNKICLKSLIEDISSDWKEVVLNFEIDNIEKKLNEDLQKNITIFPPKEIIFNAFNFFNFSELKVVLISQDPYIHSEEAMGLAFSVPQGKKIPPSLRNIFKEIERTLGKPRKNTDLSDWAKQGVLLLNQALTVRKRISGSHILIWYQFTEEIIKYICQKSKNIVFILWGNHAKEAKKIINPDENLILEWSHPSPLSRKPFTPDHFNLCNQYLLKVGKDPIVWV